MVWYSRIVRTGQAGPAGELVDGQLLRLGGGGRRDHAWTVTVNTVTVNTVMIVTRGRLDGATCCGAAAGHRSTRRWPTTGRPCR